MTTDFNVDGNISATGNITTNNSNLQAPDGSVYVGANVVANVHIFADGNIYGNAYLFVPNIESSGNLTVGAINTDVYNYANGDPVPFTANSYGDSNVATFLPTYTGVLAGSSLDISATAVAIGGGTGTGTDTVAIGNAAGGTGSGANSVAVGSGAGGDLAGANAVLIGAGAGATHGVTPGQNMVAVGAGAGGASQGSNAVAVGYLAGATNQAQNSIVINATGAALNAGFSGTFVAPLRQDDPNVTNALYYNATTKEVLIGSVGAPGSYGDANVEALLAGGIATNITTTANVLGANIGNATTVLRGDGYLISNISVGAGSEILNGNSNVIVAANSNVSTSVAGVANVFVVTATGANIAGTANVTGNLAAANITATGNVTATDTVLAANVGNAATILRGDGGLISNLTIAAGSEIVNGNTNVNIPVANGAVTVDVGGTANVLVLTAVSANLTGIANVSSDLFVGGNANIALDANVVGNAVVGANLTVVGNANVVQTLTAHDIVAANSANLGAVGNVIITGGTSAQVLTTDGSGVLSWTTPAAGGVANGTSSVTIPVVDGNVITTAAGNVTLTVTGTGANIAGTANITGALDVAGNVTVANITASGLSNLGPVANVTITGGTSGQVLTTDGSNVLSWTTVSTGGLANGTSSVTIPAVNGNVITTAAGNATFTVTGTGANVLGYLDASGDITTLGNIGAIGEANITGNLAAANITANGNVTADYFIGNGSQLTGIVLPADKPNNLLFVAKNGSDSTGTGSINDPFLTVQNAINAATTAAAATTIYLAPGSYVEELTINNMPAALNIYGSGLSESTLNGNIAISGTSNNIEFDNLRVGSGRITHSATGYWSVVNSRFSANTGITKTGAGVAKIFNTDLGAAGTGSVLLQGGKTNIYMSQVFNPQISGASTEVNFLQCDTVILPTVTAGNAYFIDSVIVSAGTGNSLNALGGTVSLKNCLSITPTRALAPMNFGAGSSYSYGDSGFDYANTTFAGTAIVQTGQFQGINTRGNVAADFFLGDGGLLSNITVAAGSQIVNGNTNVNIPVANGNVTIDVTGTANVVVVDPLGLTVVGNITAANANITAAAELFDVTVANTANLGAVGNITITGGSSAQVLTTDGSGVLTWTTPAAGGLSNGNSSITIPVEAGPVLFDVNGVPNVFVVTQTGANVGNLLVADYANVSGALSVNNLASLKGNVILNGVSGNTINSGNLTVGGNLIAQAAVNLGDIANITITGGSVNDVLITDGSGVLSWSTPVAGAEIANGASNINIADTNGPITMAVNGAGKAFISATQIQIGGTYDGDPASNVGSYSVAIGYNTADSAQGSEAVAIGINAGELSQGASAVAIGSGAGLNTQGANSIAIGAFAGDVNQPANSIALNATGAAYTTEPTNSGFYVAPVRNDTGNVANVLHFNPTTNEITFAAASSGGVTTIENGTSNVSVINNGNITTGVSGYSNVIVVSPTQTVLQNSLVVGGTIQTSANITGGNLAVTSKVSAAIVSVGGASGLSMSSNLLSSSSNITIDPLGDGTADGNLTILGNVSITGNLTYNDIANATTSNLVWIAAVDAADASAASGGGLQVGNTGNVYASFLFNSVANSWDASLGVSAPTFSGDGYKLANITGANIVGDVPTAVGSNTAINLVSAGAGFTPYQSGVNTTSMLATGAANTVYTSDGGAPQWSTSLNLAGNLTTVGNITAPYFIGNGSQLTGLPGGTSITNGNSFISIAANANITGNVTGSQVLSITSSQIAVGKNAGNSAQGSGAIAIGGLAGNSSQGPNGIAIGTNSGNNQGSQAIAIGTSSALADQSANAIAIGTASGQTSQGIGGVAIGVSSGRVTQGANSVAIGANVAYNNQGINAIAIGTNTANNQGAYAIAIGGVANAQSANSIVINATGVNVTSAQAGFYVAPIRTDNLNTSTLLHWNTASKEITTSAVPVALVYGSSGTAMTSGASTQLVLNTEVTDTNGSFNPLSTSSVVTGSLTAPAYSFCPNVPGYYQVTAGFSFGSMGATAGSMWATLFRNGSEYQRGSRIQCNTAGAGVLVSTIVYLNGTGDYIQLYGSQSCGTSQTTEFGSTFGPYMQVALIRGN